MKRSIRQRSESGLSLLTCKLTAGSILNECSLIENGVLLRSLLNSFVSIANSQQTNSTTLKNENLGRYYVVTVEHSSQYVLRNGQTLRLYLQATLTNDPNALNEAIKVSSQRAANAQQKEPPVPTDGILLVGDVETLLEYLSIIGND